MFGFPPATANAPTELSSSEDWRLLYGPERTWQLELGESHRDASLVWTEIERALGLLARADRLRPLIIDMRGRARLDQTSRWAMSSLLSTYEAHTTRLVLISDVDLVQLVRLQSLIGTNAPECGRRVLSMGEALQWVAISAPALKAS